MRILPPPILSSHHILPSYKQVYFCLNDSCFIFWSLLFFSTPDIAEGIFILWNMKIQGWEVCLKGKKALCTVHYFWYLNYFALELEMYLGKKKNVPCLTFLLRPLYWDNVLAVLHFCHTAAWIFSRMKSGAIAIFYPCQTSICTWFLVMNSFDHWFIH